MPADREDLQRRLAAATPDDTVRGIVFNAGFAVVKRYLGDAAAKAADPVHTASRVDFFSYPVADYLAFAWAAADALEPVLGNPDAAFRELGAASMRNVFNSMLGRTLLTLGGDDPRQLLAQAPSGYRATISYGERTLRWAGPTRAVLSVKRDFLLPVFHAGVLAAAVQATGKRDVVCTPHTTGPLDFELEISWTA